MDTKPAKGKIPAMASQAAPPSRLRGPESRVQLGTDNPDDRLKPVAARAGRVRQLADAPLQLGRLRQLLQGAPAGSAARPPARAPRASVVDRSNRAEVLGDLNPARRVPTLVLDDGRRSRSRTRSSGTSATTPTTSPTTGTTVPRRCSGNSSSSTSTSPRSPSSGSCSPTPASREARRPDQEQTVNGYTALDAMERHLAGRSSSSASGTRSPTSRSTPTRTWRTREGSTCGRIRRSGAGSSEWRPARARHDRRLIRASSRAC